MRVKLFILSSSSFWLIWVGYRRDDQFAQSAGVLPRRVCWSTDYARRLPLGIRGGHTDTPGFMTRYSNEMTRYQKHAFNRTLRSDFEPAPHLE